MIRSTLLLSCLATTVACTGASSGMHHQTQLPNPVPPANADFDSIAVPPPTCVDGWQITLLPRVGSDPQWAVAPDGKMHIMYIGYGAGQMALRHVAEATPQEAETVGTMGLGSLAIAPDGTAHAFLAARSGTVQSPDSVGIVHVSHARGGWLVDPAQVSSDGGMFNASAIDGAGHAHLAFGNGGLYYASNASGQWVKTAVGTQTQVSVFGLDLDRDGHVHIWFTGIDSGTAVTTHWATNASGTWRVVVMPDSDVVPAVDRQGVAHGITSAGKTAGLNHVWWQGDRWRSEPLPALGDATAFDLSIDENDKMHLVLAMGASSIVYANNVSGSWTIVPVISADTLGLLPSGRIGLDRDGNPHIAFKGPVSGASFGFAQHCP